MEHTPGPWFANEDCIEIDGPEGPRDVTLAVVLQPDNAAADARLIAAAPELLHACQLVAACLGDWIEVADRDAGTSEDERRLAIAYAAIAKAEGRSE